MRLKRGKRTKVPVGQEVLRDDEGRWLPSVRVERVTRDPRARLELAEIGVEWPAGSWGLESGPMLPDDFAHLVAH